MVPFTLSLLKGSMREFFSYIYCESLYKLLEIKLTKVWRLPYSSPWKFSLRIVHTEPPTICQLQSGVFNPSTSSQQFLLLNFFSGKPGLLDAPLSPLQQTAVSRVLPYRFKKSCWIFSLFNFWMLTGSSKFLTCKTGNQKSCFLCLFVFWVKKKERAEGRKEGPREQAG